MKISRFYLKKKKNLIEDIVSFYVELMQPMINVINIMISLLLIYLMSSA